jgi:hypothetical protein
MHSVPFALSTQNGFRHADGFEPNVSVRLILRVLDSFGQNMLAVAEKIRRCVASI